MVPGLPQESGAKSTAGGGSVQHEVGARARPTRAWARAGREVWHSRCTTPDQLLNMSSMNNRKDLSADLANLQGRVGAAHGKKYWRTLEELAGSEAFQELMRQEYPEQASVWPDSLSRRKFLTLMGASLALAGVTGCSVRPAPSRTIVPYVRAPEEIVPGRPLFYATAMTL